MRRLNIDWYTVGLGSLLAVGFCFLALATVETAAETVAKATPGDCTVAALKGVYSTNAVGYAPQPPAPIPSYVINMGGSFPLQAIGSFYFDGHGHSSGYVHENVGGTLEANVPSTGTYDLQPGPLGVGCTGTWTLQDQHTLPPFDTEGPHFFKINLARAAKGFHFLTFGGGPGPAVLSGFAELDQK